MKGTTGSPESSSTQAERSAAPVRPKLVFFHSPTSGRCRRVESFLANAFRRRKNHEMFDVVRVNVEERPDLAERFRVDAVPTLVIVENRRVVGRIVTPRTGIELEEGLGPWLR
jgi:thioredoxin-like negative regulator of GroEL